MHARQLLSPSPDRPQTSFARSLHLSGHTTLTLIGLLESLTHLRERLDSCPELADLLESDLLTASTALQSALLQSESRLLLPPPVAALVG
jgi:hypothetical protein